MIEKSTLFILGAGASVPYGYPTGQGLREYIFTDFCKDYRKLLAPHHANIGSAVNRDMKKFDNFIKIFEEAPRTSIDRFLSINPSYQDIGKTAIATAILQYEKNSVFNEKVSNHYENDWYSLLFQKMTDGFSSQDHLQHFPNNKVSFITFNYDRSLEHFFYKSLISLFHSLKSEIDSNIKKYIPFPFIHVYGTIDEPEWDANSKTAQYKIDITYEWVQTLKNNIKVIGERSSYDKSKIVDLFLNANRIIFLGFGYADENLDVLSYPTYAQQIMRICGTTYGMNSDEIERIKKKTLDRVIPQHGIDIALQFISANCHEALKIFLSSD